MSKSKTPKRSSTVKSSSGKGLSKKFNLKSTKVQFFVVIAIVALLGGGWFTYKSFAATALYQPNDNSLRCQANRCSLKQDQSKNSDGSKSTINVLNLQQHASAVSDRSFQIRTGTGQLIACVNARREDHRTIGTLKVELLNNRSTLVDTVFPSYTVSEHTKYINKCLTFKQPISRSDNYYLRISNLRSNPVYVSTASLYPASEGK